jgi:hypothetical protein
MQVHTGRLLFVDLTNDFCWSHGSLISVEAQFGTRFLGFSAQYPLNEKQDKAELNLKINMIYAMK